MTIRVCLAGATGWVGTELCRASLESETFRLVSAVARKSAGMRLENAVGVPGLDLVVKGSVAEALATPCDVLVDYTSPDAVFAHVVQAIETGVAVVIGTSGLTEEQLSEIDRRSRARQVGVLACSNFAVTAILLEKLALLASQVVPHWEIVDYATAAKPDAPSGTARQLAAKLATVSTPSYQVPVSRTLGAVESRGATMSGSQVHSVRLPGYNFSFEILFGLPGERLTIRHDADQSARPYVSGTIKAIEEVRKFTGLRRGLQSMISDQHP